MSSKEDLWQAFTSARDNLYDAQRRYSQLIDDGVTGFVLSDAEADLTVAEALYGEAARRWLDADRGDVA